MFDDVSNRRQVRLFLSLAICVGCARDALTPLATKTDEFKQNPAAAVDVLWVIDNSESMAEEQQGLGESFQTFIATLTGGSVDYHIGVISTDPADLGELHSGAQQVAFIAPDTPDPQGTFLENVKVGTSGSRSERASRRPPWPSAKA